MRDERIIQINGDEEVSVVSLYNEKNVEHLVDQLIKLHREYDHPNRTISSSKEEIKKAMHIVNKALEKALMIEGE